MRHTLPRALPYIAEGMSHLSAAFEEVRKKWGSPQIRVEIELLRAIRENPSKESAWRVYADALTERGDPLATSIHSFWNKEENRKHIGLYDTRVIPDPSLEILSAERAFRNDYRADLDLSPDEKFKCVSGHHGDFNGSTRPPSLRHLFLDSDDTRFPSLRHMLIHYWRPVMAAALSPERFPSLTHLFVRAARSAEDIAHVKELTRQLGIRVINVDS